MENEALDRALNEISSILRRCEKIQPQFEMCIRDSNDAKPETDLEG